MVVCVWWHLQLLFAARGPPKISSEPRRGRGIVFRNSRISLSAGRRACEPAAKPAILGAILLHNGFFWPERTQGPGPANPRTALTKHLVGFHLPVSDLRGLEPRATSQGVSWWQSVLSVLSVLLMLMLSLSSPYCASHWC
jgi:hypothetical protein